MNVLRVTDARNAGKQKNEAKCQFMCGGNLCVLESLIL